jgi:putative oxidoreductase
LPAGSRHRIISRSVRGSSAAKPAIDELQRWSGSMTSASRKLLFGTATAGPAADIGLLLLRIFAGLALAFAHGINKIPPSDRFVLMIDGFGFPAPAFFGWMSGLAEFGGGILLALGLLTRPASALIVLNFAVAVLFAHAGDPFSGRELPLLFFFIALMYVLTGPGRYSIDALIRGTQHGNQS